MSNLTPGSYLGRLIDSGLGAIGQNSTPAMVLTFELTHVAAGGDWQPIEATRRDVQFYLTERAREFAFADLRKLGFNGDFENPAFSDQDLVNGLELTVINEIYNNKAQDKVSIAKLSQKRERSPVAADVKRTLAAQWKTSGSATARPAAPPPAAPRAPAAASAGGAAPTRPAAAASAGTDGPPF